MLIEEVRALQPHKPWNKANFLDALAKAKVHIEAGDTQKALVQIRLAELHC